MQEIRYAEVNGREIPVLISDENEALLAAKAAGRAIVGLWREDMPQEEWCAADTLIADLEDADPQFLERIARRHLDLPWDICETDRLRIREFAEQDYEEIVKNQIDSGFDTKEKLKSYAERHYRVFEFGFWAVEEKKSGMLVGVAGLCLPDEKSEEGVDQYMLSLEGEETGDDILELGYHIFPDHRRKGYAVEACQAIIRYAKEEFGITEFIARIRRTNLASQKVAAKLGFVKVVSAC